MSKPGRVPGGSRGCKEEKVLWAVRDCRDRSSSFRAAKKATNHVGSVRQGLGHQGAQKVEQPAAACVVLAAKAAEVGQGSAKPQVSVRVRVRRPSMSGGKMPRMSSGQPGLQKSVVREVEGRRARIVAGSRSRNVGVRRSSKRHVRSSARRRCQELAKLNVVADTRREERSTL